MRERQVEKKKHRFVEKKNAENGATRKTKSQIKAET